MRIPAPQSRSLVESDERPLFYLVDWLPPDFGAVGQYALMFAAKYARAGRQVHVIGLTSGAPSVTSESFVHGGRLIVSRLHTKPANKTNYISRIVWSVFTNCRLVWRLIRTRQSSSTEVVFAGSPPFMLYFIVFTKYIGKIDLVYRITDFYPEVVIANLQRKSPILALINKITWGLRQRIGRFEALGEDQRRILLGGGIAANRISIVRDTSPVDFAGGQIPAPRPPELGGRLALLYSGNYGVAHEVDTVLTGLALHHSRGTDRFALWINGSGANADRVAVGLRTAGAPVARTPPAPLGDLAALLVSADAHLITLRVGFAGLVLPSKVYGCLASRKPILFVGPESSDVHLLCSQAQGLWYRRVEPGDVGAFTAALDELADLSVGH